VVGYTIIRSLVGGYALSSLLFHFFGIFGGTFYFFLYSWPMVKDVTGKFGLEELPLFCSLDRIVIHTCDFLQMVTFGQGLLCGKN